MIKLLSVDKIKISGNKNLVKMADFLKFLIVDVYEVSGLGSSNGWTYRENRDIKLFIHGGIINGVEYLDSLEYGKNMKNPYNNYVNPFYLFDVMIKEGQRFFYDYYKEDINKILTEQASKIEFHKVKVKEEKEKLKEYRLFMKNKGSN